MPLINALLAARSPPGPPRAPGSSSGALPSFLFSFKIDAERLGARGRGRHRQGARPGVLALHHGAWAETTEAGEHEDGGVRLERL